MEFKMQVSFTDDKIVFVDSKGKAESLDMFDAIENGEAVRAISSEQKAAQSASKAAVSLLVHILDNPRLDGYKGQTPINESVPSELKAAIREMETEFLKPLFCAPHVAKNAKPATVEKLWQEFSSNLKAGGSYAVAKSEVTKYFAYCGKLPKHDNGKLLTVAAVKKLVLSAKENAPEKENEGVAGKLVALSLALGKDNAVMGDIPTAIAALKSILSVYEHAQLENADAAMASHQVKTVGDVASAAASVVSTMKRAPAPVAEMEPAKF
jgi:hypothetical protein